MKTSVTFLLVAILFFATQAEGKRKRRRGLSKLPPHPTLLWARTLAESTNIEERKIAAFKLSQYSRPIIHTSIVTTLIGCTSDRDTHIKVLCTKALSNAEAKKGSPDDVEKALLERFSKDPGLRNTIVRTLMARKKPSTLAHQTLLTALNADPSDSETGVMAQYFQLYGDGSEELVKTIVGIFNKNSDEKVKLELAKVIAGNLQSTSSQVISFLSRCSTQESTSVRLVCLHGLQSHAKETPEVWAALEKNLSHSNPEIIEATLDVICALKKNPHQSLSERLVEVIAEVETADLKEKGIMALEIVGNSTEQVVQLLQNILKSSEEEEVRIAAALVLGHQALSYANESKESLQACLNEKNSQSLKSACQLAINELDHLRSQVAKGETTEQRVPSNRQ